MNNELMDKDKLVAKTFFGKEVIISCVDAKRCIVCRNCYQDERKRIVEIINEWNEHCKGYCEFKAKDLLREIESKK